MNPILIQIRKYTLSQIMKLSPKALQKPQVQKPKEQCKKNAVKQAIKESIKFR